MYCNERIEQKLPYLTYKIKVRCKNLNPVELSQKQINLYQKICELKDLGLTYKQISNKLNKLVKHFKENNVIDKDYKFE